MKEMLCPCSSGKGYQECCKPLHEGKAAGAAVELMRSRYAAYALGLADYIIRTTHPGSPQFQDDKAKWKRQILKFTQTTEFKGLEVLQAHERGHFATVTFVAHMVQNKQDVSFTERSYFEKLKGKWLYRSGQLSEGRAPNLMTTHPLRLLPLAYLGAEVLRKKGEMVGEITEDVKALVQEMVETMDACDGLGLAAPQVHHSIRLFVIRRPIESVDGSYELGEVKVFINPVLSEPSKETWTVSEGCLSIPSIHGDVERPKEITVEYTNLEGKRVKERVAGWQGRVVMHENDHINGVLFIDRLSPAEKKKLDPFLKALENRIHNGTEL